MIHLIIDIKMNLNFNAHCYYISLLPSILYINLNFINLDFLNSSRNYAFLVVSILSLIARTQAYFAFFI